MNTYCFALIFYQVLSTHSLRKYIKISLENLYVDIMGLKGLKDIFNVPKVNTVQHTLDSIPDGIRQEPKIWNNLPDVEYKSVIRF